MQELDPREIEARSKTLPQELQDLLISEVVTEKCDQIGNKYSLSPEQKDLILEEIARIILKYTPLSNLPERLAQNLRVPRTLSLAAELDKEILSPVHHLLLPASSSIVNIVNNDQDKTQTNTRTLAEQVAQFQARKKQREAEQQKLTPVTLTKNEIIPTSPSSLQ